MKKYLHIALMLFCVIAVSSCKDDDDDKKAVEQEAYKLEQEAAFQAKINEGYEKWASEDNDGFVFAKLIKKGDGKQAYFNSLVSVYYKGSLTDGTVFDQKLLEDGTPFNCAVSPYYSTTITDPVTSVKTQYGSVITGWGVALQHMVEGDKYEVWIPQQLAYGANGSGSIPGYSTLIFEIELVSVDVQAVKPS